MKSLQSQNRIRELLSIFVTQVKGASATNRLDINIVAENVLIPLFSKLYGYNNLRNLNQTEKANFPGIDIGDEVAKVAFQVTSTASSSKIKETLRMFSAHRLYERFDHLIIYILTEKQASYSGQGFDEIIDGRFVFDKERDVRDYRDVLQQIGSLELNKILQIENLLEANFSGSNPPLLLFQPDTQTEAVYLNLLEAFFPRTLFVADLNIDRAAVIKDSKQTSFKIGKHSGARKIAQAALAQLELKFAVDWEVHENKIITFHDLDDEYLPLAKIIDPGTVTELTTKEFYEIDTNYENVFRSLMRRCLQQKLYHLNVQWQNQENVFIFLPVESDHDKRVVKWKGQKWNTRTVYEREMKSEKPNEVLVHKHFAFETQFRHLGGKWFLAITPTWFFSYDGYRKSLYAADSVKWLKRNENNQHVFDQLRLLTHFLKDTQLQMFGGSRGRDYPFLTFGELISFDSSPFLDDVNWNPGTPRTAEEHDTRQHLLWENDET